MTTASETNEVTTEVTTSAIPAAEEYTYQAPVVKNVKKRRSDEPKPSAYLKRLWHTHLAAKKGKVSLKKFAATLASDSVVAEWVENKKGKLERKAKAERQETKGALLRTISQASKSARRGKSTT